MSSYSVYLHHRPLENSINALDFLVLGQELGELPAERFLHRDMTVTKEHRAQGRGNSATIPRHLQVQPQHQPPSLPCEPAFPLR